MKGTQNCHERGNYFGLNMAVALTLYNLDSMEWFLFRNIVCYTMLQWPQSRSHIHTLSSNLLISRLYQSLPILNWTSTSLISLSSSSELNPILDTLSDQYYWGEMTNPGLGFYSRHLTEDDVQVISANTRKLIFNNGQVKHELGNDRFKSSHCVMCLIECW